ncbi:NUDIX domain-containing protein [Candidatus Gracilibacteria bacterium]|nr:NUDIX domain-containing protein [Candidatus Gracilibacteria bacterium]NJQ98023.1 NUDIX domain-containing protein [Hydrococcus sp. CSU_1_8]
MRKKVGSQLLLNPGGRAIVQNNAQKILLHKRSDFRFWDLPGGGAEEGESAEQCVIREVYEETGLVVESFETIGFASNPELERVIYPNGDIIQGFALILHITQWSGSLRTSTESTSLEFFEINNLPEMRQNIRITIDKFLEYQRSGKFQLF